VKKVREKDLNPYISPENALLVERSYLSDQENINLDNGYHAEWIEKIAQQELPSYKLPGICTGVDLVPLPTLFFDRIIIYVDAKLNG